MSHFHEFGSRHPGRPVIACLVACASLFAAGIAGAAKAELSFDRTPLDREAAGGPVVSYSPMLRKATPAVVAVHTTQVLMVRQNPMQDALGRAFGIPEGRQEGNRLLAQGSGSGVIVTRDGYVVTNNHVVTDSQGAPVQQVMVTLSDGREFPARIVGRDPRTDIAVLKVDAKDDLPVLPIADSDAIEVGDVVFAIGNPLGVGLTVTQGIVSATGRRIGIYEQKSGYENFIQTDAAINRGNSGGALVDARGRLIGVNSAIMSPSGGSIGLGFSIPANLVSGVIAQLVETGEVRRGYLGVVTDALTEELAEAFSVGGRKGVVVTYVQPDSPAQKAGILRGDVILDFAGKETKTPNDLRLTLAQTAPGRTVVVSVVRNGKPLEVKVLITDQSHVLARVASDEEFVPGVRAAVLDAALRERYGVSPAITGIIVTDVAKNSPFAAHVPDGTVISEVNGNAVRGIAEAREALRKGSNRIFVHYRGREGYIAFRL